MTEKTPPEIGRDLILDMYRQPHPPYAIKFYNDDMLGPITIRASDLAARKGDQ